MKILFYDKSTIYSGAEKSLKSLVLGLEDCQSFILFNYPMPHQSNYIGTNKIYRFSRQYFWIRSDHKSKRIRGSDALKRIIFALRLFVILKKLKPDIFHINLYRDTDWLDIKVAKLCKIKTIVHVRSLLSQVNITYDKIKNADLVLTTSEFVKKEVLTVNPILNTVSIYDPLDINPISKKLTKVDFLKKMNIDYECYVISSVGILDQRKGHDTAINSIAKFKTGDLKIILLIVGGDIVKNELEFKRLNKLANDQGLHENVFFLDHVSNIDEIYQQSDLVFALSGDGEAFGRVPLEAALYERVVIGTKRGATPEIIEHNKTGYLVDPNNPEEVSEIVNYYLKNIDNNELINIGKNAFQRLIDNFSTQKHCDQVLFQYKKNFSSLIIISIPCILLGGTEFQTLHLLKALKSLGKEVMVLVYFEVSEEMVSLYEKEGAIVNCMNWKRSISPLSFIIELKKYFQVIQPDLVHVQYMAPGALPIVAAKLAGVPRIIATVHQPYTQSHGWKAKWLLRMSAQLCNPFLSVSQNAAHSWFGKATLFDAQIPINYQSNQLTFYNSINVEELQNIVKQYQLRNDLTSFGIHPETFLIGAVSRLRIEKGIDLLITSFAQLLRTVDGDIQLLLVGDGPDRKELEALSLKLNCQDNIVFYGSSEWEEAMRLMARMDLVVVPSRFEGFGLSAAEAMAMGKPLICSNAFGLTELVCHDKEGLLFQNGDAQDLFLKLQDIMHNPEKAKKMGKLALKRVKQNFDYSLFVKRIRTLYQMPLNEAG